MPAEPGPAGLPPGGRPWSEPDAPWQPWSPAEVTARLAGVSVSWCIAAGWAMDLCRGEVTRPHEDVEITIAAGGFPEIRVTRPFGELIRRTPGGVPYLAPEIALLFKAKHARPKDVHDFTGVLPLLDPAARAWLSSALERVHPGHAWLAALGAERSD
jgi:hypothetical protein